MEPRRQQRAAKHRFHQGVSLQRNGACQGGQEIPFSLEREGAGPCSSVLSPSHLLKHPPEGASWIPDHHPTLPFPSLSAPAQRFGCRLGEGRPPKPPGTEAPAPCPHARGQQSPGIAPVPRCAACAAATSSSSSSARAALMLELPLLLLPGCGAGNPIPAFLWRQCPQLGQ